MIRLSGISKTYHMGDVSVRALRGVSLAIEPGEFVAIMGPSGSGKSTLMHILGLLDTPDEGSYTLFGQEIAQRREDELAALRGQVVGFVFQQFNLLPRTTALDNTALPQLYVGNGNDPGKAKGLLEEVGLGERLLHRPNELSGGQQQRVAIARALVNDPRLLFADEPTGNLDSISAEEIMGLLQQLNARGITVVLVTHEPDIAERARRIIRMRDGLIQSDERVAPSLESPPRSFVRSTALAAPPIPASHPIRPPWLRPKELAQHAREAGRALMSNKVRAGLSMLGIVIGVAAVIAMLALGAGARQAIQSQLASLGSNLLVLRSGSRQVRGVSIEAGTVTRLTLDDAKEIRGTIAGVTRVAPSVSGRGQAVYAGKNWNTQVLGAMPEYALMHASVPIVGRFVQDEDVTKRARVAVLGMTPVRELFGETNPIGEFVKINKVSFQVIGLLPEKGATAWRDQDNIIIPLSTAMHRLLGKEYVDSIDIEMTSPSEMDAAQDEIQRLAVRRHRLPPSQEDTFEIRNMADIQSALSETSRTMSWLLASIAAVSLLVGGIGIMNIMLVSVTERTHEIGLRKAVGARRQDILSQFLIEALVISLAGGLIGIAGGSTITMLMSRLAGWTVAISPGAISLSFLSSATIGIVFGLWPARQASLLNPIAALRYE